MGLSSESIQRFLGEVVGDDLHVKTILSLSNTVLGVLHSARLCIHVIGRAYGWVTDHDGKHGVKQVDRLLSNARVSPWGLARAWIAMLVGPREEVLVALDWTDFDKDDHTTLVASLITSHGRATPMVWKTVKKSTLAERRNTYEDQLLVHLSEGPEHARRRRSQARLAVTEAYIPFEVELRFEPKPGQSATLVLEKANASGLPEHADQLLIPVVFTPDPLPELHGAPPQQ